MGRSFAPNICQLSQRQIRLHLKTRQPKASDPSIQLEENQPLPMCGNKIPVLCNQENFLLRSNCYKIQQCLPDIHVIFKPAIKLNLSYGQTINRIILEMLEHVCVSWMIFFSSSNLPRFTQANCFLKKKKHGAFHISYLNTLSYVVCNKEHNNCTVQYWIVQCRSASKV